jgi:hypothetical protein
MLNFSKIQIKFNTSVKGLQNLIFDLLTLFYIKVYLLALFVANILIWAMSFFIDSRIDRQQIALHYNVDFGIDYYGDKNKIYIIPILGVLIIFINFLLLASTSRSRDKKFIAHILMTTALVSNIILLTAAISVYLINFW